MQKRRHHYVPQSLSRNFSLSRDTLFLYDVVEDRIIQTNPRDVFVARDLHVIPVGEGEKDYNTVETLLSQIEGQGSTSLNKYIRHVEIDNDERYWIATLWALQYLRTPIIRRVAGAFLKAAVESIARVMGKKKHFQPLPDALRKHGDSLSDLLKKDYMKIEILPHATLMTFTVVPTMSKLLFSMNWTLLESEANNYFILSDNPCSIYDEEYSRSGLGIGLDHRNVEVSMPVSRNQTLLATWKDVPRRIRAGENKVAEINRRSAIFGERFFVYPIKSRTIMRMLKIYSDDHPEPEVEIIPAKDGEYIATKSLVFSSEKANRLYAKLRPIV